MLPSLAVEIAALPRLRVSELRAKFAVVCGEPTPSHNKVWLVKRIAWRLQAQAEGDLSQRARQRAGTDELDGHGTSVIGCQNSARFIGTDIGERLLLVRSRCPERFQECHELLAFGP